MSGLTEALELLTYLRDNNLLLEGESLLTCFKRHSYRVDDIIPSSPVQIAFKLNEDQTKAWQKIEQWLVTDKPYFILKGYSGSGKSTLVKMLINNKSIFFTATTNKAAKVLSKMIEKPVKTIHSQLGLRMVEDDESLTLKQSDTAPYMPKGSIVVVDESSMCGNQLLKAIVDAAKKSNLKIIFVGDPAQLPPVGETSSEVWKLTEDKDCKAFLRQVMRNDNELLALATEIRECIKYREWDFNFHAIKNSEQITLHPNRSYFESAIIAQVRNGCDLKETKIVAWRNKTVDEYNLIVRNALKYQGIYDIGDLLLLAEPIEKNGTIIAHIDDEVTVLEVGKDKLKLDDSYIDTWRLEVDGDKTLTLHIPRKMSLLNILLNEKAQHAKSLKGKDRVYAWRDFWDNKRRFHNVRYGYALTAHRSQGGTYSHIFCDTSDILVNDNKREGFKCLYVAVSRASEKLDLY